MKDKVIEFISRAAGVEVATGLVTVGDTLEDFPSGPPADFAADLQIPSDYVMDGTGIRKLVEEKLRGPDGKIVKDESGQVMTRMVYKEIASRPVFINAIAEDVHTGDQLMELVWFHKPMWRRGWFKPSAVLDGRGLVKLADKGLPVSGSRAGLVAGWLDRFNSHNQEALQNRRTSTRMGWHNGQFLWGKSTIGGEGLSLALDDPGREELARGYRAAGSWEGWVDLIEQVKMCPSVMLAVWASLSAPLLNVIPEARPFGVDWSGVTSTGKTTTMRIAASAWGYPDDEAQGLVWNWRATPTWIERACGMAMDMPVILDESKHARHQPEKVSQVIYSVTQGRGRGRGTISGLQATVESRAVLLTTGEQRLTDFCEGDGGAAARVLSLWGSPLEGADEPGKLAADTYRRALENHGHAGPKLIAFIQSLSTEQRKTLINRYRALLDEEQAKVEGRPVAMRACSYLSLLRLAGELAIDIGVPAPACDPIAMARVAVLKASEVADKAWRAREVVYSWAARHQHWFYGITTTPPTGRDGWAGKWLDGEDTELIISEALAKTILEGEGYDPGGIIGAWMERGWLTPQVDRKTGQIKRASKVVKLEKKPVRCLVIAPPNGDEGG